MATTHSRHELNDAPNRPEAGGHLARNGSDGGPNEPKERMHDFEDCQGLRVLCRLAQAVEVVATREVLPDTRRPRGTRPARYVRARRRDEPYR
jgi:hypothetical protein